jgi:hypothetical protein
MLLAFGDDGADAGLRVEAGDAGAARAHPLGKGALRVELELELAREVLAHELGVLADVGGDHLPDLPGLQQDAEAEVVDAGVVRGDGEVLHPCVADRGDQQLGDAAEPEAAGGDRHAVEEQAVERRCRIRIDLLHGSCPPGRPGVDPMHPGCARPCQGRARHLPDGPSQDRSRRGREPGEWPMAYETVTNGLAELREAGELRHAELEPDPAGGPGRH